MQNYGAANDQYLAGVRDSAADSAFGWLIDNPKPEAFHVAIMRAAYAVASLGDEAIRLQFAESVADGFDSIFRGEYEWALYLDDFAHCSRDADEQLQLAIGFVIGAARAWSQVKRGLK